MTSFPKVLFVAGTLGVGGAERQLYYMIRTLRERGAEPQVVSLTRGEYWEPRIREIGVPVHHVERMRWRPARAARIALVARRARPDVVQSVHFYTNLYASLAARTARAHDIGAVRNDAVRSVENEHRWGRLLVRVPRTLAVNSIHAYRQVIGMRLPEDRLVYLPNVVDTSLFAPSRDAEQKEVVLMSVGRLVEQKRHDRFLRVLRRATERSTGEPPVRGEVIGAGPLSAALHAQAAALDLLPERVTFLSYADMPAAYRDASILVLTSDYEGMPNVVLEAMASGLAVVACDSGEVGTIIEDGVTGYVTPIGDEAAMIDRVVDLVNDPAKRRRFGDEGRWRVERDWSIARLGDALEKLYARSTGEKAH